MPTNAANEATIPTMAIHFDLALHCVPKLTPSLSLQLDQELPNIDCSAVSNGPSLFLANRGVTLYQTARDPHAYMMNSVMESRGC